MRGAPVLVNWGASPETNSQRAVRLDVEAEHFGRDAGRLDLTPDRAPLRYLEVAAQLGDATEPADPAGVGRVVDVEPALHEREPGPAVRAVQFPAGGLAVGEPQRRLAARLELDELGSHGVQLEAAHREPAAHIGLDVDLGAEPLAEMLRLDERVEHRLRCRVDDHRGPQLG